MQIIRSSGSVLDANQQDDALAAEQGYINEMLIGLGRTYSSGTTWDNAGLAAVNQILLNRLKDPRYASAPSDFVRRPTFTISADESRQMFEELMNGYTVYVRDANGVVIPKIGVSYEANLDKWLESNNITLNNPELLFPTSKERIVLLSMLYNGDVRLRSTGIADALRADDRAEAWYIIRYVSKSDARRQYIESNLFNLYNEGELTDTEAKSIYRMYTRHRQVIYAYETQYNPTVSGSQRIRDELIPARDFMIAEYAVKKDLWFDVDGEILVGEDASSAWRKAVNSAWSEHDVLTGSAKGDMLFGESGDDWLNGLDGGDILYGGQGNDRLEGDAGYDYYLYATGDGRDTVKDADHQGEIRWNDVPLEGGQKLVGVDGDRNGVFRSSDEQTYYIRYNDLLFITQTPNDDPGGSEGIVVEGYTDGALNLAFDPARPLPETTHTVDYNLEEPGSPTADNDLMLGTDTAETMRGNQGDDILRGNGGNDSLWGDDQSTVGGDDFLYGGAGEDFLEGEAGDDFLDGGEDNDILLGDYRSEDRGHDTLLGGGGRDNLAGFYGIDWLDGGEGDDLLGGGAAMDFVLGGAGNDILFGDDNPEAARGWTVTVTESNVNPYNGLALTRDLSFTGVFLGLPPPADQHGDVLAGGSGDDYLAGNGGNDTLLGEADNDFLLGGNGDDLLVGGTGHDILKGEAGVYSARVSQM